MSRSGSAAGKPPTRGFPDLRFRNFSFDAWLGLSRHVNCELCHEAMGELVVWPITGRCGHSICSLCYYKVDKLQRSDRWPCPIPGCEDESSFDKKDHRKSFTLIRAMVRMEEIEYWAGLHLKRAHADYVNDIASLLKKQREEKEALVSKHQEEVSVLQQQLKESEEEVEVLQEGFDRLRDDLTLKGHKLNRLEERCSSCQVCGSKSDDSSADSCPVGKDIQVRRFLRSDQRRESSSSDSSTSAAAADESRTWSKRKAPKKCASSLARVTTKEEESGSSTSEAEFE